ncbi:MAG TPA: CocE/NonD family hydrolase [Steroidobacteraceae bacterium]|nr:CocE/NonD family hydrolase [Steroidobacteraceae bacterium]
MRKIRELLAAIVLMTIVPAAWSQQHFEFPPVGSTDDAALDKAMPILAKEVIAGYTDTSRGRYLSNLFRLQMVAEDYSAASATLQQQIQLAEEANPKRSTVNLVPDEVMVGTKLRQGTTGAAFDEAMRASFRETFRRLDDRTALDAIYWLWGPVPRFRALAVGIIAKAKPTGQIDLNDALDLIRFHQLYLEYQKLIPATTALIQEDDARRYVIENDVAIHTHDGATLCAQIMRPREAAQRLPTALNFTIYAGQNTADKLRQAAARGYAGVVATERGKACSQDAISPWVFNAEDANTVIDWISKQRWSDGQVGMYGGSYEGFTQWAAAKKPNPALKTIVPYVASNPAMGLPMENNVFQTANYAWNFYVMDNRYLDDVANDDAARWNKLNQAWYASGRSYRELDRVDGKPNPLLQEQLRHPAYDRYWQSLTPYRADFSRINIPVLSIAGYFSDTLPVVQYFTDHYQYNPKAEQYLVIGPYDHFGSQAAQKPGVVEGYAIDPVAQFDTVDLTYQWLDYVLRHGKKPDLIQDRVNYEVMGANLWRHESSIANMSDKTLTLYLTDAVRADRHGLDPQKPGKAGFLEQTVDFADRSTRNNLYPSAVLQDSLDTGGALSFISEPLEVPMSVNGRITADIRAEIDKRDVDVTLAVYEITPDGKYFNLCYYLGRASYARDMSVRRLLRPGETASIPVRRTPLISRQLSKGSRLLVLLTVNKNEFGQINYGTGKDVSDESIADAKSPLHIRWLNDSYITVPIWSSEPVPLARSGADGAPGRQ